MKWWDQAEAQAADIEARYDRAYEAVNVAMIAAHQRHDPAALDDALDENAALHAALDAELDAAQRETRRDWA